MYNFYKEKISYPRNPGILIDNMQIKQVKHVKFLGTIIDEHLTWHEHLKLIGTKISKNMGIIYKIRHSLPQSVLPILYCSLILPYLNYSNIVWGSTYTSRLSKIEKLQKKSH